MASILTVSQINRYISSKIKGDQRLKGISVKGEISNFRQTSSGHIYFSLKDAFSLIRCVMFSGNAKNIKASFSDGIMVVVYGELDVYEKDGTYQIIVRDLMALGEGGYSRDLAQLKDKLSAKGYFSVENKRPIPKAPKTIGVVASKTSAALQDILNVIGRRYPIVKVFLFHATVQGEAAARSVASALKTADSYELDTLIIARGGGSNEDLSCFDSETVADAVFNLKTPCISAVGHETDFTVCDMTADYRAPTPSAAAEVAVPNINELYASLDNSLKRLKSAQSMQLNSFAHRLNSLYQQCVLLSPVKQYELNLEKYDALNKRLISAVNSRMNKNTSYFSSLASNLEALSPLNVLLRGYSITSKDGKAVTDCNSVNSKDIVEITFSNGKRKAEIL